MNRLALSLAAVLVATPAFATSLQDLMSAGQQILESTSNQQGSSNASSAAIAALSQTDAARALKDALVQGARQAVQQLGQNGGFANNPNLRIGLPGQLGQVAGAMKMLGMGQQVSSLEDSMNHAAEAAVPQALDLLIDAVQKMSMEDAKAILAGSDTAATDFLQKTSRDSLRERFLPVVKQSTDQVGLVKDYNTFAGAAAAFGKLDTNYASMEGYVTEQALNGLFSVIGEKEAEIRQNPAKAATDLARRVFGLQ